VSVWVEIKHAINSTLGSANFKPLDKIFDECCGVFASDNVLYDVGTVYGNQGTTPKTLKMTGTIRVASDGLTSSDSLSVWLNGKFAGAVTQQTAHENYAYITINIKYGDEITFSSKYTLKKVQICGTPYFAPRGGIIE
jgi:hypothetical protein